MGADASAFASFPGEMQPYPAWHHCWKSTEQTEKIKVSFAGDKVCAVKSIVEDGVVIHVSEEGYGIGKERLGQDVLGKI